MIYSAKGLNAIRLFKNRLLQHTQVPERCTHACYQQDPATERVVSFSDLSIVQGKDPRALKAEIVCPLTIVHTKRVFLLHYAATSITL